ncbi:MAG TPA: hypothetical protein VK423_06220 [Thermoplasmata archaeon]|nr:hypothetical protein [Thermoplasmata archaeon]
MAGDGTHSTSAWEEGVRVREDPALEAELISRFAKETGLKAVGVTDLISLRRAFYRTTTPPVPIPPERQVRLDAGRELHRALGGLLAREGILEARVRQDGLVGRIDILADVPIEVKTATAIAEPSELAARRPEYLEQLGMYCALTDHSTGRLLTIVGSRDQATEVQALELSFRSVPNMLSEMRRRAAALRVAWAENRPDGLPRCPWYGRGCEFEAASVCACTGEEELGEPAFADELEGVAVREDLRERVRSALYERNPSEDGPAVGRFRAILYPRRAYFEETSPTSAPPPAFKPAAPTPDLYARLSEAVESGPAGEVARLPTLTAEVEDEVVGFRGRPILMKTSRAWARLREDELAQRTPQYGLDLGLRCATTGTDSGIVVLAFDRARADRDRIQVFEYRFASLTPFSRLFRERSRSLLRAIRDRSPIGLAACPGWMVPECPYRSECGCGAGESRVTR